VTEHAAKAHVPLGELQVGVADAGEPEPEPRLSGLSLGRRLIRYETRFRVAGQGKHRRRQFFSGTALESSAMALVFRSTAARKSP